MVHYFYFVREMHAPTRETIVYHVRVGSSDREQVKFALVNEYCRDCGFYFKRVSDVSDSAVRQLEKRLFAGSAFFISPLRRASVTISELYTLIIDDAFIQFEASYTERKGSFNFRCLIDPLFYARTHQKKSLQVLPPPSRKYLKSGHAADLNSFLIGSAIVTIIFLIAAYLDGVYIYHI